LKLMGGRSKGAMPTLFNQRSPITRLFTQFQLEVNNQLSFMFKDMPREYLKTGATAQNVARLSSAAAQLALYSYLFNEGYYALTGRRPAFDVIGMALDLKKDLENPELKKSEALTNFAEEAAGQLPFVGSLLGGGRIPISSAMPDIFKLRDTTAQTVTGEMDKKEGLRRIGNELLKPATYINPFFGGGQVKKTYEGLKALSRGGEYARETQGGEYLKYPIEKTPGNIARAVLFGKSTFPETREFYDSKQQSLSVQQTMTAQETGLQLKDLQKGIQLKRKLDNTKDKDPVKTEILQYYEKTGDTTVFTDSPQRTFTVDGESVKLTEEQYREYVKKINKYAKEQIEYSKKFDSYKLSDSATKYDFLRKAVNMAESRARKELNLK
jgi:hypothetical protein